MHIREYKMTMVIRILASITALPLGLILLAVFFEDSGARDQSSYVLAALSLMLILGTVAIWVYHSKKRIIVKDGQIEQHSLFGKKAVSLNGLTSITYSTMKANIAGVAGTYAGAAGGAAVAVLQVLSKNWSEDKTSHVNLTVSDGSGSIKLNSNLKEVAKLRDDLAAFEVAVILPRLSELYRRGQAAGFGPIKLQSGQLLTGQKSLPLRSISDIEIKNGALVVKEQGKRWPFLKISTTKVINVNSFLALAKEPSAQTGK